MKPDDFIKKCAASVPRVVVCTGDESFFQEEVLQTVVHTLRGKAPDTPVQNFEARQGENDRNAAQRLLRELCTAMLFGGPQLFVVRNGQKLLKEIAKELAGRLSSESTLPNRLLLFTQKVDGRTRFAKLLKEQGGLVECKKLFASPAFWQRGSDEDTELNRWTVRRAAKHGLELSGDGSAFLTALTGNDLFLIDSELNKIALSQGVEKDTVSVGVPEVEQGTGMSAVHTPFDLWDKIEKGSVSEALKTLSVILRNGLRSTGGRLETDAAAVSAILMSIFRDRIRLASQVALFVWQKLPDKAIMERLKLGSNFYLEKLKASAQRLTAESVKEMNSALLEAERRIKRQGQLSIPVLEALVIRLARAET